MHTWTPFTVTAKSSCIGTRILLVKMTHTLTKMKIVSGLPNAAVKVQTGTSMESLLTFLEQNSLGILTNPALGDVTVGGVLAIGGHGTGVPSNQEKKLSGFTYGSISNLVVSFTAVVWYPDRNNYALRTFHRSESEAKAFLISLGRTFLTDVTLRVGPNYNLRCVSKVDIPANELFALENAPELRTLSSFLDSAGRLEVIWFPFTKKPWLKLWTVSLTKPTSSRVVTKPYNYPFSDNIPETVANIAEKLITGLWYLAPIFGNAGYASVTAGLILTDSADTWGPSKNLLLYLRSTTFRVSFGGYAIIMSRSNVQYITSLITNFYQTLLATYQMRGEFPINNPIEIRVTGLDLPEDINIPNAESPSLSPIRPVEGYPELNTAVWFNVLTLHTTPLFAAFMSDIESYLYTYVHNGITVIVRPEWSKGWGFTKFEGWANVTFMRTTIPSLYYSGLNTDGWDWTVSTLNKYDPDHVLSNDFIDSLLI